MIDLTKLDKPTKEEIVELFQFMKASELTGYIPDNLIKSIHKLISYYINENKEEFINEL